MDAASKAKGNDKHCCVPLCNGNGRRHMELSFHRFPQTDNKRNLWIQAIRRDPGPMFNISDQTVVCSRHFKPTDFKWTPVRKTLKPDSVPSIFDWSNQVTPRREIFKHPVPQKRPRSASEDEAGDDAADLGCEPIPEFQDGDLSLCAFDEISSPRVLELEKTLQEKEEEIQRLQEKLQIERFGIFRFSKDDSMISFYTGHVHYIF
ncbi:unnamed protein product [Mytilus coruscus]|uniref:THAP-type domain-containing protein n=1 Tax=Mytilus coruscus TaxID=42192 RepID=A0A6J8C179_MYTCO|nr:unnamed protein product [Mytilus coruscus]